MPKIILIGFMGSGKTTVGKILANALKYDFVDSDDRILELSGEKSVADIFKTKGETGFRELEHEVAKTLANLPDSTVIATGGGMIVSDKNRAVLKENFLIIYLETSFESIKSRVELEMKEKSLTRPLFSDVLEARKLFESRLAIYEECAKIKITTDKKSPEEIVREIISRL